MIQTIRLYIDIWAVYQSANKMSMDLGSLASSATPIAVGGIAGFLMGYAIKKVIKIVLIIAGLVIVAYVALGYQQYVSVDWSKIHEAGSGLMGNVSSSNIPGTEQSISSVLAVFGIPLVGSLAAGFILGFIKG